MNIRTILWGVDGILLDNFPTVTYAMSRTISEMGYPLALNVIDGLVRQSVDHCLETLAQRLKLDLDQLAHNFEVIYSKIPPASQALYQGVREVCALLDAQGGKNLILTYHNPATIHCLLDAHALDPYFAEIVHPSLFGIEPGCRYKSDPETILSALVQLAIQPEETLLISRCGAHLQAGQAAGMLTCVLGELDQIKPGSLRLNNYSQLGEFIQGSTGLID